MSEVKVYSVLDRKVREFGQLLLSANDESMERTVRDVVSGSGTMMEKYPEDFDLHVVGSFNTETGELARSAPQLVGNVALILDSRKVSNGVTE